jgi:TRAP-type C4-dicarboxylate transport system permease small subunit
MQLIRRIDNFFFECEKFVVVVLFSMLVLAVMFNIISRNLFQFSFNEIFEVSPVIVVWTALAGATIAMKKKRHIRLELFLRYCPGNFRKLSYIAGSIFGMAVTGVLLVASFEFVGNEISIFGIRGWFSIIFPVFFSLSCFRYFTSVVESIFGKSV